MREGPRISDKPGVSFSDIQPLLVGVQTNPERDVSLEALAGEYGLSPSHFQRVFTEAVGESPRAHVERLRLERAAWRLYTTDRSILEIALDLGFQNHETFSRAFKRKFGKSPSAYRKMASAGAKQRLEAGAADLADGCWLSDVTFLTLKPMSCIALRRFGPYEDYANLPAFGETDVHFFRIAEHLEQRGVAYRKLPITIPYDNPRMTPAHLQQADACLPVLQDVPGEGEFRRIDLKGGLYAAVEHRGPFETLIQAYIAVGMGAQSSKRFVRRPDPPIQIFREISPDGDPMKHLTEVYSPVERAA